MASTSSAQRTISVLHLGQTHTLHVAADATLATFQQEVAALTSVPPHLQKLLYKGKKAAAGDDATLDDVGLRDGTKVMLHGSTEAAIDNMKATEAETQKQDAILRQRATRGPTKVRSTATPSSLSSKANFKFHRIQPLAHLPNPAAATAMLQRLADDPAIQHVMQQHEFAVGVLTELAPHEQPHLLGLNENKGQAIKLRIRTDAYDGFRPYGDIRRVLCHELTHNVWGDHDNNFKELNSRLNKEVAEFERAKANGTHHLGGTGDEYDPGLEADARARMQGGTNVLGGSSSIPLDDSSASSRAKRRQRVLEATMKRLAKEEQEIEDRCGS